MTVIIWTRNRAVLLEKCVEALLNQSISLDHFSIPIVDNDSTDSTPQLIARYEADHPNIASVHEGREGLSFARNTAYQQSSSERVAYLDDDEVPHIDWQNDCFSELGPKNSTELGRWFIDRGS